MKLVQCLLPQAFFYAGEMTASAKRLVAGVAFGLLGLLVGGLAVRLITTANWREILAGVLLGWSVSLIIWAVASFHSYKSETWSELRRTAEVDLLHARLNQIAQRVGARTLNLEYELGHALGARMERLAHFARLDEFRSQTHAGPAGHEFWDETAPGQ